MGARELIWNGLASWGVECEREQRERRDYLKRSSQLRRACDAKEEEEEE